MQTNFSMYTSVVYLSADHVYRVNNKWKCIINRESFIVNIYNLQ